MKSLEKLLVDDVGKIQIHLINSQAYLEEREEVSAHSVEFWEKQIKLDLGDIQKGKDIKSLEASKRIHYYAQKHLKELNELIEEIKNAFNAKYEKARR